MTTVRSALDAEFARILDGEASLEETKAFLAASVERMGDPEALAAGARAMRARMIRVSAPEGAIDVCGTGGDGAHTLNISTAVAFVLAGAGVPVAKHGNRAMSSKCGAADVLEALGVKLTGDVPTLERCLREANVAFLFAQNHHPSMRHVAQARKELGHRTIFNLLGPLSNPAGVRRQMIGVFAREFIEPMALALRELGAEHAIVLHGAGGLDELSFVSEGERDSECYLLQDGRVECINIDQDEEARAFDQPRISRSDIAGGSAEDNANALRALLQSRSENSAYEATVLLNATYALGVAGQPDSGWQGWEKAERSIRSGAALDALNNLICLTQDAP